MEYEGVAGSVVNRQEAHAVRLALIYSLALGHEQIEVQDLKSALAFTDYARKSAFMIFGSVPDDKRKGRILDALKGADGHQMSLTDIRINVFNKHIKSDALQKLIDEMASARLIDVEKVSTVGAPKTLIKLSALSVKSVLSVLSPDAPPLKTLKTLKTHSSEENAGGLNSQDNEDEIPDFDF